MRRRQRKGFKRRHGVRAVCGGRRNVRVGVRVRCGIRQGRQGRRRREVKRHDGRDGSRRRESGDTFGHDERNRLRLQRKEVAFGRRTGCASSSFPVTQNRGSGFRPGCGRHRRRRRRRRAPNRFSDLARLLVLTVVHTPNLSTVGRGLGVSRFRCVSGCDLFFGTHTHTHTRANRATRYPSCSFRASAKRPEADGI